ncbi:hypothetical protein LSM04_008883 [Trypanosoma melophagium]|uniref:uncharacterized protein n=1 Tax=Trypanosoma melophagium TaxID=715481 RepID=UPI00351A3ABA|nr:hypothetical protein LSM04_008883 [Trypanosoma melophagium]
MLRRLFTLYNRNTLCAVRRISKTATQTPLIRGRQVETGVAGKKHTKNIIHTKGVVKKVKSVKHTTRNSAAVENKTAVRTKKALSTSPLRKTTKRVVGRETRSKRPHAHTVQKMKYNKRVAAIAKLWRMQKKKNTPKVSKKPSKK